MNAKDKIINFVKKETVLTVAIILAIISSFVIKPSLSYVNYIDFKSLETLWSLMVIMEGLKSLGVFERVGASLLHRTKKIYQLVAVLVFLCFFLSMFITNDVALLTFVPFALYMLDACDKRNLFIPVIVLQTLAANLGSMLTPIGNPQNLYLYGLTGMELIDFILIMLPYSLVTFVMLTICIFLIPNRTETIILNTKQNKDIPGSTGPQNSQAIAESTNSEVPSKESNIEAPRTYRFPKKVICVIYVCLFIIALLSVARIIPVYALAALVLIVCLFMDRYSLKNIDYALLFTFIGFFIFTGNLGNIPAVRNFFTTYVGGHELLSGVIASQFISNVPAALLLSGFSTNLNSLIVGVNLGGLGTLIASMASLISFKILAHSYNEYKGRYFIRFTIMNLIYLGILLLVSLFSQSIIRL